MHTIASEEGSDMIRIKHRVAVEPIDDMLVKVMNLI